VAVLATPTAPVRATRVILILTSLLLEPQGAKLGMTSDDIFWWTKRPIGAPLSLGCSVSRFIAFCGLFRPFVGKVLVNGAGYIALECAGFLHEVSKFSACMIGKCSVW
jgi:hypothetical protein